MLSSYILVYLCATPFSLFFLITYITHLCFIKKSKSSKKKIINSMSVFCRISMYGFVRECKCYYLLAKTICVIYWVYLFVFIVGIVALLFEAIIFNTSLLFALFFWGKISLDIPIFLLFMIFTCHDKKHGGLTWRWPQKDKKM